MAVPDACSARSMLALGTLDTTSLGARVLLGLIRFYQLAISPWLGRSCRFEPSCSRYAAACISSHGAAHGSLLSLKRLCKCHPFHAGGYDPPPGRLAPPRNQSPNGQE